MSALVSGTHVDQQMFIERISSVKLFTTVLTFVCFVVFMMNNSVIVKTVFGDKPLTTDTAQEWITVWMINLKIHVISCYV